MRQALELALDALELVNIEFVCNGAHHAKKDRHELGDECPITVRYQKAITAIKEALAQPPLTENGMYRLGYHNGYGFGEAYGKANAIQHKPLSENEIKHLWYEACQTNLELTSQLIVHLARAIEAAHNIKE